MLREKLRENDNIRQNSKGLMSNKKKRTNSLTNKSYRSSKKDSLEKIMLPGKVKNYTI